MQVIEKVKVVPEGYNGAGMDGYGRRDVNGKANAGLTLGIIGTALGAWALFGNNRRSTGLLGAAGGGGDPVLAGTQIDEQIQLLEGQKQLLMARQRQMQQGAIIQQQQQLGQQPQAAQVSLWDSIDAEVEPLTNEQRQLLSSNEEYVNNYNALQNMVQVEVLNLVRAKIENSEEGRNLLTTQLKLVKSLKTGIVEKTQRDMELFNAFKEASKTNPSLTYDAFINSLTNGTAR